jgi:glycine oxidase
MSAVRTADLVIVGGGLIGLALAWRAGESGLRVTVVDPAPGTGASQAAAGMLAPVSELDYGETALLELNLASSRLFPGWAEELHELTGRGVGYRDHGTVSAAWDGADLAALRDRHAFQQKLGLDSQLLSGRELRELEPACAPGLPGGLLTAGDHQVDPVRLHAALLDAAAAVGVELLRHRADAALVVHNRCSGIILDTGDRVTGAEVVLAGGAWIRDLGELPPEVLPPVRPVKGQTLHLRAASDSLLKHVVRGTVRGLPVYLVPRSDGRLVIGASSEEAGFDQRPRAGAVYELLRDAQTLVPEVSELELERVAVGLRPATPDNAPVIGRTALPGLTLAGGHYRNGVLLTPVTAESLTELLIDGLDPPLLKPFSPRRFARFDKDHDGTHDQR